MEQTLCIKRRVPRHTASSRLSPSCSQQPDEFFVAVIDFMAATPAVGRSRASMPPAPGPSWGAAFRTCRRGSSPGLQPKPAPQRQAVATHPRFGWLTGASPPLASAPAPSNGRRTSWTSRRINALLRGLSTPCPSFIQRQGLLRTKYIRYILSACQLGLRVETKGHY